MNWRSLHQWSKHFLSAFIFIFGFGIGFTQPMPSAHRHYLRHHFRFWAFLNSLEGQR